MLSGEIDRARYTNSLAVVWVDPRDCDAPHVVGRPAQVEGFVEAFEKAGFDLAHPAVIGYPLNGRIQLLSGSHRYAAAIKTNTKLPVTLWLRSDIEAAWGNLEEWARIMRNIPVTEFDSSKQPSRSESS